MPLHVLVLAGGIGSRLWPLSRKRRPKHLLPLGPDGVTLLRSTVERVRPLTDGISVVTTAEQAPECQRVLEGLGGPAVSIIAEPVARGTGPALGLATAWIARTDPDAVICSVHADHHVGDDDAYRASLYAAAAWAVSTNGLATVGIRPTAPATGYGYVELGAVRSPDAWHALEASAAGLEQTASQAARLPAHQVAGFVEKPELDVAERIATDGRHLWNLGLFAWPARVFAEEINRADALLASALEEIVSSRRGGDEAGVAVRYSILPTCAVEPLIMEGSTRLSVVSAGFPWSDLGAWPDIHATKSVAGGADANGNVVEGDGIAMESRECLISALGGRTVAVLGADNLIVIDTGDAVLVVPASEAQRVKDLTDRLSAMGRSELR